MFAFNISTLTNTKKQGKKKCYIIEHIIYSQRKKWKRERNIQKEYGQNKWKTIIERKERHKLLHKAIGATGGRRKVFIIEREREREN